MSSQGASLQDSRSLTPPLASAGIHIFYFVRYRQDDNGWCCKCACQVQVFLAWGVNQSSSYIFIFVKKVAGFIQRWLNHVLQGCTTRSNEGHHPVGFSDLPVLQQLGWWKWLDRLVGRKTWMDNGPHNTGLHISDVSGLNQQQSPPNIFLMKMADEGQFSVRYTTNTAASMLPCVCLSFCFTQLFVSIRVSAAASIQTTRSLAFPPERLSHSQSSTHT